MRPEQQLARAAGRIAGRWLPRAKQYSPTAKRSGQFFKHVVPAVVKPLHSLWHEILGFTFLLFAAIGTWKIWHHSGVLPPLQLAIVSIFVIVMSFYGVSSIRKSRRITRSR